MNRERVVRIVYDKSGCTSGRFFYIFFLKIINFKFVTVTSAGIVTGKFSGLFKYAVRHFSPFVFYNYMGTRHFFGVKPPVISGCKFKGQFIILIVIFADVHVIAIG